MTNPYEDILHLPHHVSRKRSHMSMTDRAAQFSPFAALTGYEEAIEETGRLTQQRVTLSDYDKTLLDRKQQWLLERIHLHPKVTVTHFVADLRKDGGSYETITGHLKQIDEVNRYLIFTDGRRIPLAEIVDLEDFSCADSEME